jgi:nucleoid-associated protein YgaU
MSPGRPEPGHDFAILGRMTDPSEPADGRPSSESDPGPTPDRPPDPAAEQASQPAPQTPAAAAPSTPGMAAVRTTAASIHAVPILAGRRPFARTTPVVVDRGRATFGLPSLGDRRQLGQIGLVVLMIAALGAILLARVGTPQTSGLANGGSPTPHASAGASPTATPRASASPTVSPGPSATSPSGSPSPAPTPKPRTYTVKSGDTLSSIAARFHTTAKIIEQLNGIKSPFVIHPGKVLKLP